ncbi:MAG: F0F1 ATP synthase subunit delta [Alphaproteobacteria bacterium]
MAAEGKGLSAVGARYASALYELAEAKGQIDDAAAHLKTVQAMLHSSDDLRRMVSSPLLGRERQSKAMAVLLERARVSDLVRRFVGVVAANGRLFALGAIADAYLRLLAARRGEVTVEVQTAQPLDDRQMQALGQVLRPVVGEKVAFDVKVDAALLGGLVVRVGSRMFDSSLRTKLQRLQLAMKGIA